MRPAGFMAASGILSRQRPPPCAADIHKAVLQRRVGPDGGGRVGRHALFALGAHGGTPPSPAPLCPSEQHSSLGSAPVALPALPHPQPAVILQAGRLTATQCCGPSGTARPAVLDWPLATGCHCRQRLKMRRPQAVTTAVALEFGLGSSLFAVALCFTVITMYDAAGVRRHAGFLQLPPITTPPAPGALLRPRVDPGAQASRRRCSTSCWRTCCRATRSATAS